MPANDIGLTRVLSDAQVQQFIQDGFVRIDRAFPSELADEGRAILWRDTGCDPNDSGDLDAAGHPARLLQPGAVQECGEHARASCSVRPARRQRAMAALHGRGQLSGAISKSR